MAIHTKLSFCFLVFIFFWTTLCSAQSPEKELLKNDSKYYATNHTPMAGAVFSKPLKVTLKDGSRFYATRITPMDDNKSLKITIGRDSLYSTEAVIDANRVKKIKRSSGVWKYNRKEKLTQHKGIYFQMMTGLNGSFNKEQGYNSGMNIFQFSSGFFIHPKLSLGLGFAIDKYDWQVVIPLFLESKLFLAQHHKALPYLGLRAGAGPSPNWGSQGGLMLNPHLGINLLSKKCFQLSVEFGVKMQQQVSESWGYFKEEQFNRYQLSVGFSF